MILYLDASALAKLYVDEDGSPQVRENVREADVVATSEITYVEVRTALARRHRESTLKRGDHRRALRQLHSDWPQFLLIAPQHLAHPGRRPDRGTVSPPRLWRP